MGLSRWGDKVEGLKVKLTPAEQVSVQARMLELTQMRDAILDWLEVRSNLFEYTVELVDSAAYEVRSKRLYRNMNGEEMVAIARVVIDMSEIDTNTKTASQWTDFMNKVYHRLSRSISDEIYEKGGQISRVVPTTNLANITTTTAQMHSQIGNFAQTMADLSSGFSRINGSMNTGRAPSVEEEDAALESIRRSMGK